MIEVPMATAPAAADLSEVLAMVRGREQPPSWHATLWAIQALTAAGVSPRCWPPAAIRVLSSSLLE
jgi:hypothetical protein